ncbi:MAG: OmpH family outer membrane protein [Agarilytica sp.]
MLNKLLIAVALGLVAQVSFAGKIAILDPNQAIFGTQFAQARLAGFKATPEFAKMKADYESFTASLEILDKERKTKSMTWGDEEKEAHRNKMEKVAENRQLALQWLKSEENKLMKTIVDKYQPNFREVVQKYMEENKIEFTLRPDAISSVLDSAEAKLNITDDIAAELDKLKK